MPGSVAPLPSVSMPVDAYASITLSEASDKTVRPGDHARNEEPQSTSSVDGELNPGDDGLLRPPSPGDANGSRSVTPTSELGGESGPPSPSQFPFDPDASMAPQAPRPALHQIHKLLPITPISPFNLEVCSTTRYLYISSGGRVYSSRIFNRRFCLRLEI